MGINEVTTSYKDSKMSTAEEREHEPLLYAKRTTEVPSTLQMRVDYDVRTDSLPVYLAYAANGIATSSVYWLVYKFTYDVSNRCTLRQSAFGAWDNRSSLSYA